MRDRTAKKSNTRREFVGWEEENFSAEADRNFLSSDVMYTCVTHAGHVLDVTDLFQMAALAAVLSRLSNVDFYLFIYF